MYRRKKYSFRLLRAFEGWKDDKDVSWYSNFKFVMDPRDTANTKDQIHKMESAKAVIRSITVGELFQKMRTALRTLENMFNVGMEEWDDNTKLGEVMTKLNRRNAEMYSRAVPLLVDVSKYHHPKLRKALEFLNGNHQSNMLDMYRVYEVQK